MAFRRPSLLRHLRVSTLAPIGCSALVGVAAALWLAWWHASFDPTNAGIAVALGVFVFLLFVGRSHDDFPSS